MTADRRGNGLASDLEVVRARTEVEATAAEVPPIEQAIRAYIHVLSTLLALQPTALSDELSSPSGIPPVPDRFAVGKNESANFYLSRNKNKFHESSHDLEREAALTSDLRSIHSL